MLLQEFLTRQASDHPIAPAVRMGPEYLEYGELDRVSNRIARLLHHLGAKRHDRVCLFLPKSPLTVAAMLGTLKADCIYVPMDLASPPLRMGKIVAAADPAFAFVKGDMGSKHVEALGDGPLRDVEIISVDDIDLTASDSDPLVYRNSADDPAHILFTSGSTGDPKGVVVTHRNVASFVEWATAYFGIAESDKLSGHPPFHFDLSTFDIYGTFLAGAELHLGVRHRRRLLGQQELLQRSHFRRRRWLPGCRRVQRVQSLDQHVENPKVRCVAEPRQEQLDQHGLLGRRWSQLRDGLREHQCGPRLPCG